MQKNNDQALLHWSSFVGVGENQTFETVVAISKQRQTDNPWRVMTKKRMFQICSKVGNATGSWFPARCAHSSSFIKLSRAHREPVHVDARTRVWRLTIAASPDSLVAGRFGLVFPPSQSESSESESSESPQWSSSSSEFSSSAARRFHCLEFCGLSFGETLRFFLALPSASTAAAFLASFRACFKRTSLALRLSLASCLSLVAFLATLAAIRLRLFPSFAADFFCSTSF